jgi:hypothetical protein
VLIGRVEFSVPYNLLDISYGRAANRSEKYSGLYTKKYISRQLSEAFVLCVISITDSFQWDIWHLSVNPY